ncbi:Smr/MutS family protein [Pseudaestuariivita rosea]|uniref:Smr/MutS family protein n=1 Tax=Pseudaestuariivita rosea TaxID=2763263 RepID=UPI001ABAB076|nr:Smr/MutS family protein [Pseudaestuariivita rosea]
MSGQMATVRKPVSKEASLKNTTAKPVPVTENNSISFPVQDTPKMDAKSFKRMKRGVIKPDARIDLHGMTLARAHGALTSFVTTAFSQDKRLLLVITGKGLSKDQDDFLARPRGLLKQQVPQWLALPPFSNMVLQVSEAHQRHGGSGAYYVYLKRRR